MAITFFAEGVKLPAIKKRETGDWIKNVAGIYGKKCGDISYIFCSDEKILEINREYLDHDYYTDIITFDYTEKNRISGDIFMWNQRQRAGRKRDNDSKRKRSSCSFV